MERPHSLNGMNTYDPAEHPRAKTGEFTNKHRDEPKSDGLAVVPLTSTPTTDPDGWTRWHTPGGQLHRTDGPAATRPDGYEAWYLHGEPHRTDGPAYVEPDGTKLWYQHGKLHRTDGPAVVTADGTEMWFENGVPRLQMLGLDAELSAAWNARTPGEA